MCSIYFSWFISTAETRNRDLFTKFQSEGGGADDFWRSQCNKAYRYPAVGSDIRKVKKTAARHTGRARSRSFMISWGNDSGDATRATYTLATATPPPPPATASAPAPPPPPPPPRPPLLLPPLRPPPLLAATPLPPLASDRHNRPTVSQKRTIFARVARREVTNVSGWYQKFFFSDAIDIYIYILYVYSEIKFHACRGLALTQRRC